MQSRKRLYGWRAGSVAFLVIAATALLSDLAQARDPKVFETPEAAAQGMIQALERGTKDAIVELLGDSHNDELFTEDEASEQENRGRALAAAKEAMTLQENDDGSRTILIGKQQWPVPFPIVRDAAGWSFDVEDGLYELLARRIGANEIAAMNALSAFVDAERDYAAEDRDGDDVLEYATRFVSTPGKKDGLYWDVAAGSTDQASPLLSFISQQGGYLQGRESGDPVRGYDFRILTRQGEGAPGGRHDYVINGNMIAGFAAIAIPSEYGVTGIMTFVVNQSGKIYEQDLGDDTTLKAAAIQQFDLDPKWQPASQ
jgi:hypothetical protein